MSRRLVLLLLAVALATAGFATSRVAPPPALQGWQVHEPIVSSNLVIFPVTSASRHDTSGYLTLDEGLRTGEVEVTELGAALIRRRPGVPPPGSAQVNKLVLINHSAKPLILLAGEIVTGGKQDRVIAKDRIIPPAAAPLPLDVFCVEPGRWHGASLAFRGKSVMAAPKVREKAAVAKNQQEVWDATEETRRGVVAGLAAEAPAARRALADSSSYALLESNRVFKGRIDTASGELQRELEQSLRGALKGKNVVGVVIAINGEVVWADLFADANLFQRYWPKLLRSYIVEALGAPQGAAKAATVAAAEQFLAEQRGKQIIEVEPGEYRLLQIKHARYSIFELSSLLEKTQPTLHYSKLRKELRRVGKRRPQRNELMWSERLPLVRR